MAHYTYEYGVIDDLITPNPWTVPMGVHDVTITCWGAGGCGGAKSGVGSGGGGGGGACSVKSGGVSFGDVITIVVGSGGTSAGTNYGGDSFVKKADNTNICKAAGGLGRSADNTAGVLGGDATNGIGDTKHSGGRGGNGSNTTYPAGGGGGGGGGAGTLADGGSGSLLTGGNGSSVGGGNGGSGSYIEDKGTNGFSYGGGGGGARIVAGGGDSLAGGKGGSGHVTIDFYTSDNIVMNIITSSF